MTATLITRIKAKRRQLAASRAGRKRNPLKLDPTRTQGLRRPMIQKIRLKFAAIKAAIIKVIQKEDALGLTPPKPFVVNAEDRGYYREFLCNGQPGWFKSHLIEVPDIRQEDHYSCGAAAAMSVGRFFNVGPSTLEGWKKALGTGVKESTHPRSIERYLDSLGLTVRSAENMTIQDLKAYAEKGWPVICPIQDYGPAIPKQAKFAYGHYLTVIGVDKGYVFCQDSSEDNVIADSGSIQKPGRVMVAEDDWLVMWHDKDSEGRKFIHYGIAVGSRQGSPTADKSEIMLNALTENTRWKFHTSTQKLAAFRAWIKRQLDMQLLEVSDEELWQKFIAEGFRKGAGRSFDDVRRANPEAMQETLDFYHGRREEFLRAAFAQPESIEKVKLLAARSFNDLQGITQEMSTKMSRALVEGLTQGFGARDMTRSLNAIVDIGRDRAEAIARTELIRAHAAGQLQALGDLGVEEVGVAVEYATAQDDEVCPACEDLEGIVLSLDEAEDMIPVHPNCRCAWIPANVGEDSKGQTRGKRGIESALESAGEKVPSWIGADADISKDRPKSIFNRRNSMPLVINAPTCMFCGYPMSEHTVMEVAEDDPTNNVFCPTGPGGGVDPSCGAGGGGAGAAVAEAERKATIDDHKIRRAFKHEAPHKLKEFNKLRAQQREMNKKIKAGVAEPEHHEQAREAKEGLARLRKEGLDADRRLKAAGIIRPGQGAKVRVPGAAPPAPTGESGLATSPAVEKKNLGGGVNGSYKVKLADGSQGAWKPRDEEADFLRAGVSVGTYYHREAAAYSVAKAIGVHDLVPETVERKIEGQKGSLMRWAERSKVAGDIRDDDVKYDNPHDRVRAACFDYLIGNTDRHSGNWMIQDSKKFVLIDHGLSFPHNGLGEFRSSIFSQAKRDNILIPKEVANWDESKVSAALAKHRIVGPAASGVLKRLRSLKSNEGLPLDNLPMR